MSWVGLKVRGEQSVATTHWELENLSAATDFGTQREQLLHLLAWDDKCKLLEQT